jgi:hypothetical protein
MSKNINLDERQVKALESIANSLDALSLWFEEIDKDEWGDRVQFYLSEYMKVAKGEDTE